MKRGDLQRSGAAPVRSGGELARMARPVLATVGFVLRFYHWPVLVMVLVYLASGITSVRPGEVALVLRFGRLVGATPTEQVNRPGLLWALPSPIDEVLRVDVETVRTLELRDLSYASGERQSVRTFARRDTIDPELHGYCLTGDRNVLQARIGVRYRVEDALAWTLSQAAPEEVLRDAVLSAMVQSSGEISVDDALLGEGRTALQRACMSRAQAECEARGLGVKLVALEFIELKPPLQVLESFNRVFDTLLMAVTAQRDAERYREQQLPGAQADARRLLAEARNAAESRTARARGESEAFRLLLGEAGADGDLLRERLYRETLERAFQNIRLRVLPPPPDGERYEDFRITVPF